MLFFCSELKRKLALGRNGLTHQKHSRERCYGMEFQEGLGEHPIRRWDEMIDVSSNLINCPELKFYECNYVL